MDTDEFVRTEELSYKIVDLAMIVKQRLKSVFDQDIYRNALVVMLRKNDISAKLREPVKIYFEGEVVGDYHVDLLVEGKIIVECRISDEIDSRERARIMTCLNASGLQLGLLLNFGKGELEYQRLLS